MTQHDDDVSNVKVINQTLNYRVPVLFADMPRVT